MASSVITPSSSSPMISIPIIKHSNPTSPPKSTAPPSPKHLTKNRKIAISTILILCNSLLFMSFGATLAGAFSIGLSFNVHDPTTAYWIAASYPLTLGAFVLPAGRLGAVFGSKTILLIGGAGFILFSFVNGFCAGNMVGFVVVRALTGVGAALVLPNVVGVIGRTFAPGETGRGISFGMLGFGAPVGGTIGFALLAVFTQFAGHWRWFFFCLAGLGVLLFAGLWLVLPNEEISDEEGSVDWLGAGLGVGTLIVFNVAWNQAPAVGWSTLYEIILLFLTLGLLVNFILWEHKYATTPIMPLDIWTAPSFFPLVLVILFSIMSYGIAIWYMITWQQLVRHWTPLQFAAGLSPHAVAGSLAAPFAAWLIPRIAAQWILAFGTITVLLSCILLATMPEQQSYWAQVFPATILMSLCPDFNFTAAQIIATNSVKKSQQGVAGSLIWLLQLYGASIGLGFAGTVEANVNYGGKDVLRGYRGALYLAAGLAAAALVIDVFWVRVPKDKTEGWLEEREDEVELKAAGA